MSQNEKILAILREANGDWVAMPVLAEGASCFAVHSRVADLRAQGHEVENQVLRKDGTAHSYYRIAVKEQLNLL